MSSRSTQSITELLSSAGAGDEAAQRQLWLLAYRELHEQAGQLIPDQA